MKISERVRHLEKKLQSEVMPNLIIEVLDDGMVEVYADKDGGKVSMTEAEYDAWAKRYQKKQNPIEIVVEICEWDLEEE